MQHGAVCDRLRVKKRVYDECVNFRLGWNVMESEW